MSDITVKQVQSRKELRQFIQLPWTVYSDDAHWVPPLLMDMKNLLNKQKNPFFLHSEADLFLARKDGNVVGRIAAIINHNHNRVHNEKIGFFGFFESIDDAEVAVQLINTAKSWVRARGMTALRGPTNFSTNDTCGMLSQGFDSSPVLMMTYNPQYYLRLMREAGLAKLKELWAYHADRRMQIPDRYVRFAQKTRADKSIRLRTINLKDFENEVRLVKEIYDDAWENNWGFVPMTSEEIRHMAKELKPVLDPELVYFAEVDGEVAGFSLSLPDYNVILKHINGRLLPFGIFKLLLDKRKIKGLRVIMLGVKKKFQKKRGLPATFYYETYCSAIAKGYTEGEFSWILEDNDLMNRTLETMGAHLYKRYSIYECEI